jgi:MoaA/NifB/PqqE/SkfB family radical SAM enzyme
MRYPTRFPDEHPDDPRTYIPNIEFYITNVCNLTCPQCNRFNDHDFKGWQRWSDYEQQYTEWATKVRLQRVTILGGEPLLNPTICDWIIGINRLWDKKVNVLTNGTRLNHVPGLYEALLSYRKEDGNWIGVSVHNVNDLPLYFEEIRKFLKGNITFYEGKEALKPDGTKATWGADYAFVDSNGVHVHVWVYTDFSKSAIVTNKQGRLTLHQSDPIVAHEKCGFQKFQSYHFIWAKLYKCGPAGLLPEFDKQQPFDLSEHDRFLLSGLRRYKPLSIDEFDTRGQQFIDRIDEAIEQCKFCPENVDSHPIVSFNKAKNSTSTFNIKADSIKAINISNGVYDGN